MKDEQIKDPYFNTGLLMNQPLASTDFIAGDVSGIEYQAKVDDGDFRPFFSKKKELQKNTLTDLMACVPYSAENIVGAQINWLKRNGFLPQELLTDLADWFNEDGDLDAAELTLAKMAGTTREGTDMVVCAQAIRKQGLVPQKMRPFRDNMSWDEAYAPLTKAEVEAGLKWLKWFDCQYEWLLHPLFARKPMEFVFNHSKQAPLQFGVPTCPGWNAGKVVKACDRQPNHAIAEALIDLDDKNFVKEYNIEDHYNPLEKKLAGDYNVPLALKILISPKNMDQVKINEARAFALKFKKANKTSFFWRPHLNGEAYKIFDNGDIKYLFGRKCPLFDALIEDKVIQGMSEADFAKVRSAEIK